MSTGPNFCSNCGEKLDANMNTNECPKCHSVYSALHEHSNHIESPPRVVEQLPYKSPGTTALIAFLGGIFGLPGIGHMYVGKVKNGIFILITGILISIAIVFTSISLFTTEQLSSIQSPYYNAASDVSGLVLQWVITIVVFALAYLALFIWQIFDARKLAKRFNEAVRTTGKEPW